MNMENMDVSGVDVKVEAAADLSPAVKAGADIATNTHKGVSKLFYALCGPWMEGRVRKAELIAAQTSKDCADIKNGLVTYTGENVIPFEPQATVASSFEALHKLNHASDAKRLHAAMREAARQISEVSEELVSDEPLSQDFFNHWRREAEMIDDEALRQWWARILVEETKTPRSISPRTLDVVKNLSQEEAEIFRTMIRGAIREGIPVDENGHPQFVKYSKRLLMHEAGLLVPDNTTRTYKATHTVRGERIVPIILGKSRYVICTPGESFELGCFLLTTVGRQIANVVSDDRSLEEVVAIAKFLGERSKGRRFSVHKIDHIGAGEFTWQIEPEWAPDFMKIQPK